MKKENREEANKITIVDLFFMSLLLISYLICWLTGFIKF